MADWGDGVNSENFSAPVPPAEWKPAGHRSFRASGSKTGSAGVQPPPKVSPSRNWPFFQNRGKRTTPRPISASGRGARVGEQQLSGLSHKAGVRVKFGDRNCQNVGRCFYANKISQERLSQYSRLKLIVSIYGIPGKKITLSFKAECSGG